MRVRSFFGVLGSLLFVAIAGHSQSVTPSEEQLRNEALSNTGDWQSNYRLGEFYLHSGKIAEGIPWMEKAIALQPANYALGYDLALAYYDTHDCKKARSQIRAMLKSHDTADLHGLLADVEESAGNFLQAATEYQTAARLDPSEEHIYALATELLVHQAYPSAIVILKRSVELYPRSVKLNVGLGIAQYLDQQYDKSMKQLCAAIDLAPSETWPYLFLGSSYAGMSVRFDTEEVRARLKHFVALEPRNADARYYYAISLWDRDSSNEKDRAEAEFSLKKAVALRPKFGDAHLQLGILYFDKGDYASAIGEFLSAVKIQPELATAHYHLAQAYMRTGQKDMAKRELQTFERIHATETENSKTQRDRVVQFVVNMREEHGTGSAR